MNLLVYLKLIVKDELAEMRDVLIEHRLLVVLLMSALTALFVYLRPFPPSTAVIAAGSKDSGYWNTAQAYARYFEANGVSLKLVETTGSVDSAQMLADPQKKIGIALIQGGVLENADTQNMQSLGSIAYEPLWIFYHKDLPVPPKSFADLTACRIGIGPQLGGTQRLMSDVLQLNGLSLSDLRGLVWQSYVDNTKDFYDRKLDVVVKVATYTDPEIQQLLNDPNVAVMPIPHAAAYQKNLPYVYALTIPASSVDIAKNFPAEPIPLIGTTTSLVVDKDLHPDLQMLLLVATRDLQRSSQTLFFSRRDEFPAYVDPTVEISPAASHYYDHGAPSGLRYFPFWLAGFFSRFWIVALSIFAFAYPVSKINLHLRGTRYHMKHHKVYEELLETERALCEGRLSAHELDRMADNLERLNREAIHVRVPTGAESQYFELLSAINLLQNKIKTRIASGRATHSHLAGSH